MRGVLGGLATIWAVTAVGYVLGRIGLLGPRATEVLARLVFSVAAPALLFSTLAGSTLDGVFTPALAAFVASTVVVAAAYVAVARFAWRRPAADATVGALCASYVNAGNLGLPVAAYVLGDVNYIVPVLMFQVLLAAPVALTVLDLTASDRTVSPARLALQPLRNPILIASAAGLVVAASGWDPPVEVLRTFELVGSAAVPLALIALGLALPGSRPLAPAPHGPDRYLAAVLKVLAQPVLAWAIGRFLLGLSGATLLAAVVTSALPTAQNVFVFATRHGRATALARDAIVLTTLAATVTLFVVVALLG
jgi:predicted permease